MGNIVQFLITMDSDSDDFSVAEVDARVPSGMAVVFQAHRSDQIWPTKVELLQHYRGNDAAEVIKTLERGREAAKNPDLTRKPWR